MRDFSVRLIKILSPGLEIELCNPRKAPADLLSLAHFPVRLKPPKLQSKFIRPESPDGDGFCCWTCSRNPKLEAFQNPRVSAVEPGIVTSPKFFCLLLCFPAHIAFYTCSTEVSFNLSCGAFMLSNKFQFSGIEF